MNRCNEEEGIREDIEGLMIKMGYGLKGEEKGRKYRDVEKMTEKWIREKKKNNNKQMFSSII